MYGVFIFFIFLKFFLNFFFSFPHFPTSLFLSLFPFPFSLFLLLEEGEGERGDREEEETVVVMSL